MQKAKSPELTFFHLAIKEDGGAVHSQTRQSIPPSTDLACLGIVLQQQARSDCTFPELK